MRKNTYGFCLLKKIGKHGPMQSRSFGKMEMRVAASIGLLTILFATATVPSSPSERAFVTLTQSFKIKVPYGETVIPAGTKLEVVSVDDPANVQVIYMGQVQMIPRNIVQSELASTEQPESIPATSPSPPPRPLPSVQQPTVSLAWGWDSTMQGGDINNARTALAIVASQYAGCGFRRLRDQYL